MFTVKSIEAVHSLIIDASKHVHLNVETIPTHDALHRVLAEDVTSTIDIPHFHRSTVDGYALMHTSVSLASASSPIPLSLKGSVVMGQACSYTIDEQSTVYVPTGGHIPKEATAVVMMEHTETLGSEILIQKKVAKWENILAQGADLTQGKPFLPKGTKLTERHLGALEAAGVKSVTVYQKPRVFILSTGNEISQTLPLAIGQVLDINTFTIQGYLKAKGLETIETCLIKDDVKHYQDTLEKAMKHHDIVIASGGSSVGEEDFTLAALKAIGAHVFVHGINIKPGKPTLLAHKDQALFFGLPGQPTSAYMVLQTFFPTIHQAIHGMNLTNQRPYIEAELTQNVPNTGGRTTFQLVSLTQGTLPKAIPIHAKAGMITSLMKADGYIILDATQEGASQHERVRVYRLGD